MKILTVKDLNVTFEHKVILDKVSFEVNQGDLVAVVGPNGAGKSTLFKAILNLIHYTGEIHIIGSPNYEKLDTVGYVPQHFLFDRTLPITVEEFLQASTKQNLEKVKILPTLQELDIDHLINRLLGELSGGELQRVLVARAILNEPKLLLLDEPISGVDIAGQKDFLEIIKHLNEVHHTTILMIMHDIESLPDLADKILALNRHLIFYGETKEFFQSGILTQLYHRRGHIHLHHQHFEV